MSTYSNGTIYRNGTIYTGGGSGGAAAPVEISQEEYDALVAAGTVQENVPYYIYDAPSGSGAGITTLTYEEYMTNKDTYDSDGNMYYVEGGEDVIGAEDVPYDNTESGIESTNVQGAIDAINENLTKLTPTLLWSKDSETTGLPAQTLQLNVSEYNSLIIKLKYSIGEAFYEYKYVPVIAGEKSSLSMSYRINFFKNIIIANDKKSIAFETTLGYLTYGSESTYDNSDYVVPLAIYGIK